MKNLVFTYNGYQNVNIGDYIQSLAAKQFFNNQDVILYHRDELNSYHGEPAKVIMNGWFTHRPENWPPSDCIHPLFLSFHINSSVYDYLLSHESISYLKKYEPIGCRDINTAKVLKEKGVDAYFSSCLTTTLGLKYGKKQHKDKIYVVDAVHYVPELNSRFQKYKFIYYYLRYFRGINAYIQSIKEHNKYDFSLGKTYYDRFVSLVRSYVVVRQILSKEDMRNIEVLTQFHKEHEYSTDDERFARAEELLEKYSEAKLVITSRIHCALPCLGLQTPVVFLKNLDDSKESFCRFEGLSDLLHIISFRRNKIVHSFSTLPLDSSHVKNLPNYKRFADELIIKVKNFLNS